MTFKKTLALAIPVLAFFLSGCGEVFPGRIPDGYYSAEAASFDDHGWKEYISLFIVNGRIVTVEYNAKNASGFIKSWDPDYMRLMNAVNGTYPNQYARTYATSLLNRQNPDSVDAITGATDSYHSFKILAGEALTHARAGNKQIALVELLSVHGSEKK
jgi:major membrane immunogen (membrane-anchored lipoprotein)